MKQQSIWQAKDSGRVSAELALLIEAATGGKVTAATLRPDLPWPGPSTQPAEQPDDDQRAHADDGAAADPVDAAHEVCR